MLITEKWMINQAAPESTLKFFKKNKIIPFDTNKTKIIGDYKGHGLWLNSKIPGRNYNNLRMIKSSRKNFLNNYRLLNEDEFCNNEIITNEIKILPDDILKQKSIIKKNELGEIIKRTLENGDVWIYSYSCKDLIGITNNSGEYWSYTYDYSGNMLSESNSLGVTKIFKNNKLVKIGENQITIFEIKRRKNKHILYLIKKHLSEIIKMQ